MAMWCIAMLLYRVCVDRCDSFCLFEAEDGIRDLVRSRGLGDVYKRQAQEQLPHLSW